MIKFRLLAGTLGVVAAATGLAACGGGGTHQGSLKTNQNSECKATYAEHGKQVKISVQEHGPATVVATVTDSNGNKHGGTVRVPTGQSSTVINVHNPSPPISRVRVSISEKSGTTTCFATS
ncbi:MAG: hypothetical protein ACREOL_08175 [Candidatus Dormibacteria bacterium]